MYKNNEYGLLEMVTAKDLISEFENIFPGVDKFYFIYYTPTSNVEKRISFNNEELSHKDSMSLFGETKWDFEKNLISTVQKEEKQQEIIEQLLQHSDDKETGLIEVNSTNIKKWLSENFNSLLNDEVIGITSICKMKNDSWSHIPMMDFTCSVSAQNLEFIKKTVKRIGFTRGIILNSGRSYHFYGFELLTQKEWVKFMGKCLLVSPFTDIRFIAHRIISGKSILRINSSKLKKQIPKIVGFI